MRSIRLVLLLVLLLVAAAHAQDAGVVLPAGDNTSSAADAPTAAPAAAEAGVPAATTAVPATTAPPVVTAASVTETPAPATETPAPTSVLPELVSDGASSASESASGAVEDAVALPDADASSADASSADASSAATAEAGGSLSRAKLIVIIVLSAAGACVMLALLGWGCTRKVRGRRTKLQSPSALPVVVPGPDAALGNRYDLAAGTYGRIDSSAMIAVMGDPVDDKRPSRLSRLSTGTRHSHAASRASGGASYRLSRPLDASSSPSSFRGSIQLGHPAISSSRGSVASRLAPFRGLDFMGTGGSSDAGSSSADDRPSYSSLVEFHQSGEGIVTSAGIIRTSSTLATTASSRPARPESPSMAVLELHRFSGTSSTASLSSPSALPQRRGPTRVRSIVIRDLTQPSEGDFRSSEGSSSSLSSLTDGLGFSDGLVALSAANARADDDTARLEWYNSIKSPTDDDRYTRLSLGGSDGDGDNDGDRRSGGDRQSYEL